MIPSSIYISGPMTGHDDLNFPAFNAAADALRAQGFTVINPADHGVIEGAEWADYLRADLAQISQCEAIYMLPGWSKSKGARLEHHVATELGMRVFFAKGAEQPSAPEVLGWVHKTKNGKLGSKFHTYEPHCDNAVRDDGGEKIAVVSAANPTQQGLGTIEDPKEMARWLLARRSHLGSCRDAAEAWCEVSGAKSWDNYTALAAALAAQAKKGCAA